MTATMQLYQCTIESNDPTNETNSTVDEQEDAIPSDNRRIRSIIGPLPLTPELTKKSVSWLNGTDGASWKFLSPATISIERADGNDPSIFAFGGLQMISTVQTIEVYYQSSQQDEPVYLTTSRGVKCQLSSDDVSVCQENNVTYQQTCVVPGGPRPVSRVIVHLKQQPAKKVGPTSSNSPTSSCTSHIELISIRLTSRVVVNGDSSVAATTSSNPAPPATDIPPNIRMMMASMMHQPPPQPPPVKINENSQSAEWSVALAGLSFQLRHAVEQQAQVQKQQHQELFSLLAQQTILVTQLQKEIRELKEQQEQLCSRHQCSCTEVTAILTSGDASSYKLEEEEAIRQKQKTEVKS